MIKLIISILKYPLSFIKFKSFGSNIRLGFGGRFAHCRGISLGRNIFIGPGFIISGRDFSIGNNVLIGPRLLVECDDHKFNKIGKSIWDYRGEKQIESIIIENDVWLGGNVTILKNVTISEGSIVVACSLLTKSTLPYSISVGSPCKPIKSRFSSSELKTHLKSVSSKYSYDEIIESWKINNII